MLITGVALGIFLSIKFIAPPSQDINIGKIKIKCNTTRLNKCWILTKQIVKIIQKANPKKNLRIDSNFSERKLFDRSKLSIVAITINKARKELIMVIIHRFCLFFNALS